MAAAKKRPEDLRSHRWFGAKDLRSFGHRSRAMQMGWSEEDWAGKPVIGILNTWWQGLMSDQGLRMPMTGPPLQSVRI